MMILATFLPAAAAAAAAQETPPGWENTTEVKDGDASKLRPESD